MEFNYTMTIQALVDAMNNGSSQSALYAASRETGKAIPKDVIPYVFKAAHYDYENNVYKATESTTPHVTIEELLPIAKQLQKAAKVAKLQKEVGMQSVVVLPATQKEEAPEAERIQNVIHSNLVPKTNSFPLDQLEAKAFILQALDLTMDELATLKSLTQKSTNSFEPNSESIYDAVKQLGGRDRTNKTYYLSKEVIKVAADYCEDHSVKVSQFIEVAILDAIKKYQ